MKKNYIILLAAEILMLLFLIFNIFISNIFTTTNIHYVLLWVIALIFLILTVGLEKEKALYKIDVIQWIVIYVISYFMFIYILGLFFGFVKSAYSLSLINILRNLTPVLVVIVLQELIRYIIISKSKENKIIIAITSIMFIAFDVALAMSVYSFTTAMGIFEFIFLLVVPSIVSNLLFMYLSYKTGYKATILYRLLMEAFIIILPIYPELGTYIKAVLAIVFPLLLFLKINSFYAKSKTGVIHKNRISRFLFWAPVSALLICMIVLISGLFKVYGVAVATGSMTPNINIGDTVIVEKLSEEELLNLDLGQIIAFEKDGILIVHRIVDMYYKEGELVYQTKGDNNPDVDNYVVEVNKVKGIVRFRIPYIGYPSIWLNDLID